jgi:hypothetical protein
VSLIYYSVVWVDLVDIDHQDQSIPHQMINLLIMRWMKARKSFHFCLILFICLVCCIEFWDKYSFRGTDNRVIWLLTKKIRLNLLENFTKKTPDEFLFLKKIDSLLSFVVLGKTFITNITWSWTSKNMFNHRSRWNIGPFSFSTSTKCRFYCSCWNWWSSSSSMSHITTND